MEKSRQEWFRFPNGNIKLRKKCYPQIERMIDKPKPEYSLPVSTGSEKFKASLLKPRPVFSVHKPSTANNTPYLFRVGVSGFIPHYGVKRKE